MKKIKWNSNFRTSLFAIGVIAIVHQALAYEMTIADAQTRAVVEKRKTLIDAVPDERLKQLFPLPQDKTALVEECLTLEVDIEKRRCLETVAQGYFEGNFKEEGQTVCAALKGAVWGKQSHQHCLCYGAPTFVAVDKCLAKEDQKLQALLKVEEKANLLERLLTPLKNNAPHKTIAAPEEGAIITPQPSQPALPKTGDLGGEVLGEPIPVKEPGTAAKDPAATASLKAFLENIKDKRYFEIFTP